MSISRTWRRTAPIHEHNPMLDMIKPFPAMLLCVKMNVRVHICKMPGCEYFEKCHNPGGQI